MKNNAKEFLDAISENQELREYLEKSQIPEGMKKEDCLLAAAEKFGYAVTKEELEEALRCKKEELKAAVADAEEAVREIPMDELDTVAGGGILDKSDKRDHEDCKFTFKDKENCWYSDGCDLALIEYHDYICNFADVKED